MKHIFIIILMSIIIAGINKVIAGSEPSSKPPGGETPIQGFVPDFYESTPVKGPSSQIFDVRGKVFWEFINTENNDGCICRILPTKDKGKFPKIPIFSQQSSGCVIVRSVNRKTAFVNLSGCTGVLLLQ